MTRVQTCRKSPGKTPENRMFAPKIAVFSVIFLYNRFFLCYTVIRKRRFCENFTKTPLPFCAALPSQPTPRKGTIAFRELTRTQMHCVATHTPQGDNSDVSGLLLDKARVATHTP